MEKNKNNSHPPFVKALIEEIDDSVIETVDRLMEENELLRRQLESCRELLKAAMDLNKQSESSMKSLSACLERYSIEENTAEQAWQRQLQRTSGCQF